MNPIDPHVEALFENAIVIFLKNESDNIISGISERNLCGCLAGILREQLMANNLSAYYVDLEYNRKQNGQIKTVLDENLEIVAITCDLIG